jgi:hypothetical protein
VLLHGVEWPELPVIPLCAAAGAAAAPVFDADGQLAGLILGLRASSGAAVGPGGEMPEREAESLVLPAASLEPILARLRRGESRRLGWLGIAILQEGSERQGVRVWQVLEGSPAHEADIRPGDVLLQVDDSSINRPQVFTRHVARAGAGATVDIRLLRDGRIFNVTPILGPRPFLICRGVRSPGVDTPSGPLASDLRDRTLDDVLRENRLLRQRIELLEGRLRELEDGGQ